MSADNGMGSIVIRLHYPTREERQELINYLEDQSWDYTEDSAFKTTELDGETKLNKVQE